MPTVHISLPSKTYEELKKKAGELGIQVTDLVKIYIKNGLEKGFTSNSCENNLETIEAKIKILEENLKQLRKMVMRAEGRYKEALEYYQYLNERIDFLEEMVVPLSQAKSSTRS